MMLSVPIAMAMMYVLIVVQLKLSEWFTATNAQIGTNIILFARWLPYLKSRLLLCQASRLIRCLMLNNLSFSSTNRHLLLLVVAL